MQTIANADWLSFAGCVLAAAGVLIAARSVVANISDDGSTANLLPSGKRHADALMWGGLIATGLLLQAISGLHVLDERVSAAGGVFSLLALGNALLVHAGLSGSFVDPVSDARHTQNATAPTRTGTSVEASLHNERPATSAPPVLQVVQS